MRVVTFQTSDITNTILQKGIVQTKLKFPFSILPHLRIPDSDKQFIELDGGRVVYYDGVTYGSTYVDIMNSKSAERVFPFYAYHKHSYCGDMCNMSIKTIYRLASHFIAYMGFDMRDIIELEVPDEEVFKCVNRNNCEECLLLCIKKEWLVSILHFKGYVTEPAMGENALYYENEVFNEDTYRMCYSSSIVLSGHGYGDILEYCMSPELIRKTYDVSIQRDYVQPDIYNLFKKYVYVIRHGLDMAEIKNVDMKAANAEMPEEINPALIQSFNVCKAMLYMMSGVNVKDTGLTYEERSVFIQKD